MKMNKGDKVLVNNREGVVVDDQVDIKGRVKVRFGIMVQSVHVGKLRSIQEDNNW